MKAVILPSGDPERLFPMTTWMPEFMLPVVNKPVVEHLIELLVRADIKEIILILKHMPYETEKYFGKGERWGARISYSLEKKYAGIGPCLNRIRLKLDEDFLCLPGNMVTDIDFSGFAEAHREGGGIMTVFKHDKERENGILCALTPDEMSGDEASAPLIMTPEGLTRLLDEIPVSGMEKMILSLLDKGLTVHAYKSSRQFKTIGSGTDYLEINKRVLEGEYRGLIIPGEQIKDGIWIGRQTVIHPEARISSPSLIGNNCNLLKDTAIGNNTVIGDNVIVDKGVSIERSVVLQGTYIGSHTEIKDSVVRKNFMMNVPRSTTVYIGEDFILGDMDKKVFPEKMGRIFNLLLSVLLVLTFSPVLTLFLLYHLVFPSKRFFYSKEYYGNYGVIDIKGNIKPRPFHLFRFRTRSRLLQKLPGLFNVIRGEMNLVGISPLTEKEANAPKEEWEPVRFKAPVGLFHLWEVENITDPSREEKLVADNYYSATRTFWGDVKILLKSILPVRKISIHVSANQ